MVVQATLSLFGSFFVMLLAGVPISAGIGIASVITALFSMPADIFALIAAQRCFSGLDSFSLLALPFFTLGGNIMNKGGIARRLIRLARLLVEKSYREGDFVLASGRRSDYYFDCRVTALHAEGSWLIGTLFNDLLKDVPVVGVGGMTMGADPLVSATTAISHELGRPLNGLLVRKEAKDHGTGQFVEGLGNFKPGDKVAMLEDVVTTGGSLLKACDRVRAAGLDIVAVCCILDREEGGREKLKEAGYELHSLFTRKELVEMARS